jgi:PhnB protein
MQAITPYLNFDGTCREAMTFYQQALGGELYTMSFAEHGFGGPDEQDRLLHARLKHGDTVLMASDTMKGGMPFNPGNNIWISLACDSDEEVDTLYPRLSAGGKEIMAPHDAFWGARFAMFTDPFGMNWMLNHERTSHG